VITVLCRVITRVNYRDHEVSMIAEDLAAAAVARADARANARDHGVSMITGDWLGFDWPS
jgi:hypothetical protein